MTHRVLTISPTSQPSPARLRLLAYLLIGISLITAALYGMIIVGLRTNPDLDRFDYIVTFTAGTIARAEGFAALYDLEAQRVVQARILGANIGVDGVLPFNHAPLLVPLIALITTGEYVQSYLIWATVLALVAAVTAAVLYHVVRGYDVDPPVAVALSLSAMLFFPIFMSIVKGQDTLFILLGIATWLLALGRGRDRLGGAGLTLTLLKPHITLLLALPLYLTRRRMWWWFCAVAAALGAIYAALLGPFGARDFLGLLRLSAQGEGNGMNPQHMYNLTGLLLRNTPLSHAAIRVISWSGFLVALLILIVLWRRGRFDVLAKAGLSMIAIAFASPHLHYHDLSVLAIPLLALALAFIARGGRRAAAGLILIPACSLLLMSVELAWPPASHITGYFVMAALAVALWRFGDRLAAAP